MCVSDLELAGTKSLLSQIEFAASGMLSNIDYDCPLDREDIIKIKKLGRGIIDKVRVLHHVVEIMKRCQQQ